MKELYESSTERSRDKGYDNEREESSPTSTDVDSSTNMENKAMAHGKFGRAEENSEFEDKNDEEEKKKQLKSQATKKEEVTYGYNPFMDLDTLTSSAVHPNDDLLFHKDGVKRQTTGNDGGAAAIEKGIMSRNDDETEEAFFSASENFHEEEKNVVEMALEEKQVIDYLKPKDAREVKTAMIPPTIEVCVCMFSFKLVLN
ncbi:hypothetical protein RFI_18191 [Reticulomyxa filosa]|uniref:Uncharacterized protein n=1 Tax=Reticulomyxa filosa TaxID=46433 RepID=X6N141_RETFI|nr:hypothetical protein RFI_18191 [Reticulomyxa filosa]|eukprot:ETO19047.1 hypothetical protein RFI_18191 [Reticulomyxa filosa]